MNLKRLFLTGYILFFVCACAGAQPDWELKLDKDGIKVYTKKTDKSPFKAVKTVCAVNSSLTSLTAVLLDIKNSADWVYATKTISLLKQLSVSELVYYSEIQVPWPVVNRDFIVQLIVSQDPKTKTVSVVGNNKPDYLPANTNIIRIQHSYSKWLITPLPNGQVKIEYILEVDPGGTVPAWLINMFATKGPFETFKKLREEVKKPAYQHASFAFIKE
ncbi:MAG: START domain-containing protein [Bacteroidota bacterium]